MEASPLTNESDWIKKLEQEVPLHSIDILASSGIRVNPSAKAPTLNVDVSNNPNKHAEYAYQDSDLDFAWFKSQADWLAGLDEPSLFLLKSYTFYGDRFINAYARISDEKKLIEELARLLVEFKRSERWGYEKPNIFAPRPLETVTRSNILKIVEEFYNRIGELFRRAPPLNKPMRVFRGLSMGEASTMPGGLPEGKQYPIKPLEGVVSTSFDPVTALSFMTTVHNSKWSKTQSCCLMDIVLRPGVQAIWLDPVTLIPEMIEREIVYFAPLTQTSFSHQTKKWYREKNNFKMFGLPSKVSIIDVVAWDVTVSPIRLEVNPETSEVKKVLNQKAGRRTKKRKNKRRLKLFLL
jgi:hypothetical protein